MAKRKPATGKPEAETALSLETPASKSPDLRDAGAQHDENSGHSARHPGAPEPLLERGYGDEHGGYLIHPDEAAREPALPGVDPGPGARS